MIGEMGCDMEKIAVLSVGAGTAIRDMRSKTSQERHQHVLLISGTVLCAGSFVHDR